MNAEILTIVWDQLRAQACYRQTLRRKTRIVWWPTENIFPQRTDFVRRVRAALPRRHPEGKQILAAVRRLESCTLPWAPTLDVIHAADDAMFTEGDKFSIDMQVRRDILIDVLHTASPDTTSRQIAETMFARFQALHGVPAAPPSPPRMTPKASPHAYADFISAGWTDAQLIEAGFMVAAR
jgi:hypothetical protein